MVVEEIAYDEPNKHSRQSQLKLWRAAAGDHGALNRTPVAPPWRRDRSLEGGHFGLRATSVWITRQAPPVRLTFNSPSAHPQLTRAQGECW